MGMPDVSDSVKKEGKVKFFSFNRRYGFIAGDDNVDYFYHLSECKDKTCVNVGQRVCFTVFDGDARGKKGLDVKSILEG